MFTVTKVSDVCCKRSILVMYLHNKIERIYNVLNVIKMTFLFCRHLPD